MGITHVVRGEEHLSNTPKQQMIWDALGHTPPVWAHVPVVVNEERKKLSKRRDRVALEMYRDEGYLAPAMVNFLMTLGWMPKDEEIQPWAQMETDFRLADVTKSPAFFDLKKLGAFNGAYIRMMSTAEFTEACLPYLTGAHAPWPAGRFDRAVWDVISPHVQPRAQVLSQVPAVVDFLFLADPEVDPDAAARAMAPEWAGAVLADTIAAYAEAVAWDADTLQAAFEHVCARHELKMGKAQAPVRVAVTGRTVGPPLFESLHALGRDETLRRLQQFQGPVG
jgi:glutamyl-tRNA synthetase